METLESVLTLLLAHCGAVNENETLPLLSALGRVTACDIVAPMNVPPFDQSPLDGYALHSEDIAQASRENPVFLRVIGEACAGCGEIFHPQRGEALRIMTGAPVPPECDCVIRQEDTDEGMELAAFYAAVKHGANVCRAGEDVRKGALIVRRGERLTSAHIGVLSSLGFCEVTCRRRVRAALLSTGDEITRPGNPLSFGKIYESNSAALAARLIELGIEAEVMAPRRDDAQLVADTLTEALARNDILMTTGGVSVGKKDILHQVLPLMGAERLFWKVAMKPGMPTMAGQKDGKLIICLSGNPFSALACFEVFAVPVLRKLSGEQICDSRRVRTVFRGQFGKAGKARRIVRAFFDGNSARLTGENQSNGSLSTMIGCNCLIDIPAGNGPLCDGDEITVILL